LLLKSKINKSDLKRVT